jgi:rhodanese-related sulfurtransferase
MTEFFEFVGESWYLFVALAAILGWLVGTEVLRRLRGITSVSPMQALQLINHQDAVILDVREGGEYKTGHIPNARHIPLSNLKDRLYELQKLKDKPVIVYCAAGISADGPCALLKENGFATVHALSGGLSNWQNAGLPVTRK